jgi:hypothetical protein
MCKTFTVLAEHEDNDSQFVRYEIPAEDYNKVKQLLYELDVDN